MLVFRHTELGPDNIAVSFPKHGYCFSFLCGPVSIATVVLTLRGRLLEAWLALTYNRAPVAQLVEHRAVTREVVSSTPAGPTLRIFK